MQIRLMCRESCRPTNSHEVPASTDFHMPSPELTLPRHVCSPPPANTTLASLGATATAPIEPPKNPSLTFFQFLPASVVFQTPPPVPPNQNVSRCPRTPVTAPTRPPRNGPIS